ncbi:glycosyl transferase family 1 [Thermaurantimonas aggregans]|uniref:Glycosyl transferase family 1 n=1 Tax=Thermaurantimonas aggregans TaxID=2173829 RepID=A0A401XLF8_9FLAO|nr:glycosyltransferase family 4 protein [Thermaurantimonas aggregans]MCX8148325.1 glycosyltransferase family 4 protein [Thermaurantimonas aggregans]GCD77830.1 glycosyl transferase family 1 [Thermaurantimonas aggregans]
MEHSNNKLLIITYYWPPSGGIAVQRWLKFTKHLKNLGWEPIVYTPSNPELQYEDPSTLKEIPEGIEIIKKPIFEPYALYQIFTGNKKKETGFGFAGQNKKKTFLNELSVWIRGNFFIPDARMFWIRPSIGFLTEYLKKNPVNAVITTGPPHSMHLIGLRLKKELGIHWIADFRDPWTNIDFYRELKLTKWADARHRRLENQVLWSADAVLVVSTDMKKEFEAKTTKPIHVITNGFDPEEFEETEVKTDQKFVLTHVGTLPPSRNPVVLWKSLKYLCENIPHFRSDLVIRLVGKVDAVILESIKDFGLEKQLEWIPFVPRKEAIKFQKSSQINLLIVNNTPNAAGIMTGKLFEYLAAGKYILGIGPEDGDMSRVLEETKAGRTVGFDNSEKAIAVLSDLYNQYQKGGVLVQTESIYKYSRGYIAKEISEIIKNLS